MNNAENGYPHQTPFARWMQNPGDAADNAEVAPLQEDEHMRVDAAICELKRRKLHHYKVIRLAYAKGLSDDRGRKRLKCSRSHFRTTRESAECWLDARLI